MKQLAILFTFFLFTNYLLAQQNEPANNMGDNFSLEGALALFKKSTTLEEFEQFINREDSQVNNLDLNNDGTIDYITVNDIKENDNHVIVLSALLGEKEKHDIATINIEKKGPENVALQIFGDNDLYGQNTIAEPFEIEEKIYEKKGPSMATYIAIPTYINVWMWPTIRFIYAPNYQIWVSPFRWNYYPRFWRPFRPLRRETFTRNCHIHRIYYRRTPVRRVIVTQKIYAPRRHSSSLIVRKKKNATIIHKGRKGNVKTIRVKKRRR
jgi:hypothetical protein